MIGRNTNEPVELLMHDTKSDLGIAVIDGETVQQYKHQGVVLLKSVFPAERLRGLELAIERALRQQANYFHYRVMWLRDEASRDFCLHSIAPAFAARLMQRDTVSLLFDQVFVKEPGVGTATGGHNDQSYWPIRGNDLISLWIALDPVDTDNGAMEFIKQSMQPRCCVWDMIPSQDCFS